MEMLIIILLAPIVGAILAGLVRGRFGQLLAVVAAGLAAAAAIGIAYAVYPAAALKLDLGAISMPWFHASRNNLSVIFGLQADTLSAIMLLAITIVGFLIVLYSGEYVNHRYQANPSYDGRRLYFFWVLMFIASLVGVALSPNLLQLLIFWELNSLCSWGLISNSPQEKALKSAMKALVMTYIGGIAFLVAVLLNFVYSGSFEFAAIFHLPITIKVAATLLLLVAAWAKCAQIPFHTWLPDALDSPAPLGTSPLSSYLLVAAMAKPGVYLIARLLYSGMHLPGYIGLIMALGALLTMFMAVLAYFRQDDLNRLMAYLAIGHLGYIFIGLSLGLIGSKEGYQGAVLYILCDTIAKITLFMSIGAIAYASGSRKISELRGLAGKMPLESVTYLIGMLAATGVPPFAGFWPKFMIFSATLQAPGGWATLIFLAIESVVSFGYLLWVGQQIFLGAPSEVAAAAGDPPPAMSVAMVVGMILCCAVPIVGIPLVHALVP